MKKNIALKKLTQLCADQPFEIYKEEKQKRLIKDFKISCKISKYCSIFYLISFVGFLFFVATITKEYMIDNNGIFITILFLALIISSFLDISKEKKKFNNALNGEFDDNTKYLYLLNEDEYLLSCVKSKNLSLNEIEEIKPFILELKEKHGDIIFDKMLDIVSQKTKEKITSPIFLYTLFKDSKWLSEEAERQIKEKETTLKVFDIRKEKNESVSVLN